ARRTSLLAEPISPEVIVPPSLNFASSPVRSAPPSRARNVSAVARRSRWVRISSSRPSSLTSNSTLPRSVLTMAGRAQMRAPGGSAWCSAAGGRRRPPPAARASPAAASERRRDTGPAVGRRGLPDQAGEPRDDLDQVLGQLGPGIPAVPGHRGFLGDQRELVVERERVVGADLGAEPVLQRRDDPAAVGVVL